MAPDAGLNAWLADFFQRRPTADGVPPRLSAPPPPPPLHFPPAAKVNPGQQLQLTPVSLPPSRPIPRGWQGAFRSRKLDRVVRWKSQLVFELFQHLEADPRVTDFAFRSLRLELRGAERRSAYIPDASAVIDGETWLIEVAWSAHLTPTLLKRYRQFGEALSNDGFGFQLVTETQIRHEPRWSNVRWIVRALPADDPSADRRRRCLDRLQSGPVTLEQLRGLDLALKDLMRLTLLGDIAFDLDQPLTGATLFWRAP